MKEDKYQYLINVQYLGFRYSGWQKQPGQKTVESMILKTLKYILSPATAKILGAGRTDAKVSAQDTAFELFTDREIEDQRGFIQRFNANLPPDIRVVDCQQTDKNFNVIKDVQEKEYQYFFSYGDKNHPFCAPFMANITEELDITKMIKGASLFVGTHCFRSYTTKDKQDANYLRTISKCCLEPNKTLSANFFPERSFVLRVKGKGFMRYQIRMIMGALILLGRNELSLEEIKASLLENSKLSLSFVAPGSGLHLTHLKFKESDDNP